jgi:predicted DCC family thiol-disulfide oxidoreductase YuxK
LIRARVTVAEFVLRERTSPRGLPTCLLRCSRFAWRQASGLTRHRDAICCDYQHISVDCRSRSAAPARAGLVVCIGICNHVDDGHAGRPMTIWPDDDVILFDGVCVFCSRWVRFVATRDVQQRFRFTAIQSPYGARLAQTFGIDLADPDSNAVVHGGIVHFKSDGALTVLSHLPGWHWTRLLLVVPKALRDPLYSLIARNRYHIFGKFDACFVPDADMRARVIE